MALRLLRPSERDFFAAYLAALEKVGIPSVFLRNYERFPEAMGNDLDLFVPRSALKQAESIFRNCLAAARGELLMRNPRDYVLDLRFVIEGGISEALHLDLYHGSFVWHGQPYLLDAKLIEESCRHPTGFRV